MPRRANRRDERDTRRLGQFGDRVRQLRLDRGLTQEDLAEAADLSRAEIGLIEHARREVDLTIVCRLADRLGVTAAELVSDMA